LVEVICDTSFLIHLATTRIKNISTLETDIGAIQFILPDVVMNELENLSKQEKKKHDVLATLDYCKRNSKFPTENNCRFETNYQFSIYIAYYCFVRNVLI